MAWAMLHCESAPDADLREVCDEVSARGLARVVTDRLAAALLRRLPPVPPDVAAHAATTRFDLARGEHPAPYRDRCDRYW